MRSYQILRGNGRFNLHTESKTSKFKTSYAYWRLIILFLRLQQ